MKKPEIYRDEDGTWWTHQPHECWSDETPFSTWEDALDHALWLVWLNREWATA